MRPRLPDSMVRWTVLLALLMALVGSAWGHRGFVPAANGDLLAYVAAGGSLDDLCDPSGRTRLAHQTCDACRLVDTLSLAGAGDCGAPLVVRAAFDIALPAQGQALLPVLDPVRLSRAPPRV